MPATHNLKNLTEAIGNFIVKNRGAWNHEQWEALCAEVTGLGIEMDAAIEEHLGLLLEHLRVFYFCMPSRPPRKATAKTKVKAKTKAKVKAKAKAKTKAKAQPAAPAPASEAVSTPAQE